MRVLSSCTGVIGVPANYTCIVRPDGKSSDIELHEAAALAWFASLCLATTRVACIACPWAKMSNILIEHGVPAPCLSAPNAYVHTAKHLNVLEPLNPEGLIRRDNYKQACPSVCKAAAIKHNLGSH